MHRLTPLILMLAACAPGDTQGGPDGVTVGEAKAIDDAAAMLEERGQPVEAPDNAKPEADQ
jgi:hypothetical protein